MIKFLFALILLTAYTVHANILITHKEYTDKELNVLTRVEFNQILTETKASLNNSIKNFKVRAGAYNQIPSNYFIAGKQLQILARLHRINDNFSIEIRESLKSCTHNVNFDPIIRAMCFSHFFQGLSSTEREAISFKDYNKEVLEIAKFAM